MKRDWDIVREVLLHIEDGSFESWIKECETTPCVHDYADGRAIVLGHLEILIGSGLIQHATVQRSTKGDFEYWDLRGAYLTMQGHDFLDVLRDRTVWEKIKQLASKNKVAISWGFLKAAIPVTYEFIVKGVTGKDL